MLKVRLNLYNVLKQRSIWGWAPKSKAKGGRDSYKAWYYRYHRCRSMWMAGESKLGMNVRGGDAMILMPLLWHIVLLQKVASLQTSFGLFALYQKQQHCMITLLLAHPKMSKGRSDMDSYQPSGFPYYFPSQIDQYRLIFPIYYVKWMALGISKGQWLRFLFKCNFKPRFPH
jgi:hypothetical protein